MKTMDVIFTDEDYYDELIGDLTIWCEEHSIPMDKVSLNMKEDNVDGIDYYVVTVNETIFSYLMWREFDMSEQYSRISLNGHEGWNRYIESHYNCETA